MKHIKTSVESCKHNKPVLHLGYAFHASSCIMRASEGAKAVSQAGALLQKFKQKQLSPWK